MFPSDPHLDPPILAMPEVAFGPQPIGGASTGGFADSAPPILAFSAAKSLLEQRLSHVLHGAIEGLQYDLADFYRLDDRTAELRIAATTSDKRARSRGIERAVADITAMAGEAVVLEDRELMAEFSVPRKCGSAICVPVASDRTIHGSLWMYGRRPRAISNAEVQLIEIVAGRLAVEVERDEMLNTRFAPRLPETPRIPFESPSPASTRLHDELEVAGKAFTANSLAEWSVLGDGRVMAFASAYAPAPQSKGKADSLPSQLSAAMRKHADTAKHSGSLLERVTSELRRPFQAGECVSLAAAMMDPDTGRGTFSLAGSAKALRVRASQQQLSLGEAPPLGFVQNVARQAMPIELEIRERLMLAVGDPSTMTARAAKRVSKRFRQLSAGEHRAMDASRALATFGKYTESAGVSLDSAIVLRRC